uniref:Protein kinase domain-containing protein n=1 Tax=Phaeomonas parva TaxID=124430 RepID=A0A7S1XNW2_9STRA|mmetsp:Transcript_25581/g.80060  ORF Transcript_25581/g.80060 Transcript_25581/m.80060 type:complete len:308 (+) Transcript_25581:88-1011(+)|eukprot:CAMPEP_0118865972 /NCGR_PEP_ID=MMETSP1163-20130328/10056_1 /TAXON_ID=124430 /ORGANISM="Phaeomonas parva, Strain CCMP2877" /LENGTH=307 /DNA_ID=CAMNT_0006800249 /DNA_START=100 /DNA_END=1026 /DNA_ORIENTATION=+
MSRRSEGKEEPLEGDSKIPELDYSLVEMGDRLGDGGVGMTYEGWYGDERVAIKMLFDPRMDLNLKREFMDEVMVLSGLSHPNIVKFLGAVTQPPNLCFAMELCDTSLFTMLHMERQKLSPLRAVEMGLEIAEALEYLHEQSPQVLHRDLKSHNVLLTESGRPKLCDFGLSRNPLASVGTPSYMAPELLRNGTFGAKVDVYAFAVLLWEMLSAQVPFGGLEIVEIKREVLEGQRPDLNQLDMCPNPLIDLIEDSWVEEQQKRPSMEYIARELSAGLTEWGLDAETGLRATMDIKGVEGGDALDALLFK